MDEQEKRIQKNNDILLNNLIVRQAALEKLLIDKEILTEEDLMKAQIYCAEAIGVNKAATPQISGFIKYGEKCEDYDRSHESQKEESE